MYLKKRLYAKWNKCVNSHKSVCNSLLVTKYAFGKNI